MGFHSKKSDQDLIYIPQNRIKEKCGIFGLYAEGFEASRLVHPGLWSLQHRGQESSGIAVSDGKDIRLHKGLGLVSHVYSEEIFQKLKGHIAIGHNRYSTSGDSILDHCQPIVEEYKPAKFIALAHNGNLPSTQLLSNFLQSKGVKTQNLNDSALMAKSIAYFLHTGCSIEEAIEKSYPLFTGVFCLLILTQDKLVAVRDGFGVRPLCLGKLAGAHVVSSESCALDTIGARFIREVKPAEMIVIDKNGLRSKHLGKGVQKLDIFEFVYFARPDSTILGKSVDRVRQNFGSQLALEYQIHADLVVPVPDSSIPQALGFSRQSGIPYYPALIKNRYIHRTFISPEPHTRGRTVQLKLNPIAPMLKNKRVIVIDDSIVRGTTSKEIVKMLRRSGAKKVHLLISSPPVRFPDFYGINTPDQNDLIAYKISVEEIRKKLNVDTLGFLSFKGMIKATGLAQNNFCTSAFDGKYPVELNETGSTVDFKPKHRLNKSIKKRRSAISDLDTLPSLQKV